MLVLRFPSIPNSALRVHEYDRPRQLSLGETGEYLGGFEQIETNFIHCLETRRLREPEGLLFRRDRTTSMSGIYFANQQGRSPH